jgi:hypothetical protein
VLYQLLTQIALLLMHINSMENQWFRRVRRNYIALLQ